MGEPSSNLRSLPSVDRVVRELGATALPRPLLVAIVQEQLAALRQELAEATSGAPSKVPGDAWSRIRSAIDEVQRSRLAPVVNATGIIIHTNLGRSPMGDAVAKSLVQAATNYTNLEYDLAIGERGSRGGYVERSLALLCEAQAATIVNNCAASLVLILRHFTTGGARNQVVISRGELVQIGGGFRVPEILEASGATLREVGTTNQTTIDDYRCAIDERTAMILKVHRANFFMEGFVESPSTSQLAELARRRGIPFVEDLGSGAIFDTASIGGHREPTPGQIIRDGADLVCFSGDKLLGGPQAGIIAGSSQHVAALKREPFFRALRCDKLVFAALQTTVELLLSGKRDSIPIREMMEVSVGTLRERAGRIVGATGESGLSIAIGDSFAEVGGGALPRTRIASVSIDLHEPRGSSANELASALRAHSPPIVGYVDSDRLRLDLRTVLPTQDSIIIAALNSLSRRAERPARA